MSQYQNVSRDTHSGFVKALHQHAKAVKQQSLYDLLCGEVAESRANALQFAFHSVHVDFSKQRLTEGTLDLLTQWAGSCGLEQKRDALFSGEPVNASEKGRRCIWRPDGRVR